MKRILPALLLVTLLWILIFPSMLAGRKLAVADESRYAEIPREMIASGDWIVPRLNGFRYFEKPVLGYWMTALSMEVFGQNSFGVRFPSAAGAALAMFMVFYLLWTTTRNPSIALLGSVIFITCILTVVLGGTAVLDMPVTAFLTLAIGFFYLAYIEPPGKKRLVFLGTYGLFCGLAFLTKGFLAFVVPGITIATFLLWERKWKEMITLPWLPLLIAILPAIPWALAIHAREPDYWHYFFWEEHIRRFTADNAQHKNPFWYFIPVFIALGLPWTVLLPAGIRGLWKNTTFDRTFVRFALCWFVMPFLFFSASSGKLATYILPCFPPTAILLSLGLTTYFQQKDFRLFNRGVITLAGLLLFAAFGLLISTTLGDPKHMLYIPAEWPKNIALTLSACLAGILCILAFRAEEARRKLTLFSLVILPIFFVLPYSLPDRVRATISATPFLEQVQDRVPPDSILVSDGSEAPSMCWHFKRNDIWLIRHIGEFKYPLTYPDSQHRYMSVEDFKTFIEKHRGQTPITVFMRADRFEEYRPNLPEPSFEVYDDRRVTRKRFIFLQYL